MRLKNYGPGEVTDRLSILSLKILFGVEAGKDVQHFKNEAALLASEIRARTLNSVWFEDALELAAVNAALWHAEDDLRQYRDGPKGYLHSEQEIATLAFRIQALNDQRAALVGKINKATGDHLGEEKSHVVEEGTGGSGGAGIGRAGRRGDGGSAAGIGLGGSGDV